LKVRDRGSTHRAAILLIPEIVELDAADVERLLARTDELARYGLVIEPFRPRRHCGARDRPRMLGEIDARAMARDLAEHMAEWDEALPLERRLMHVAATMACSARCAPDDTSKAEEMNALLREMEDTPNSGQCNHGRPTYVELKLSDIERLFVGADEADRTQSPAKSGLSAVRMSASVGR